MKKNLVIALVCVVLLTPTVSWAGGHHHRSGGGEAVAVGVAVGLVAGVLLSNQAPVVCQPVVVNPVPVVYQPQLVVAPVCVPAPVVYPQRIVVAEPQPVYYQPARSVYYTETVYDQSYYDQVACDERNQNNELRRQAQNLADQRYADQQNLVAQIRSDQRNMAAQVRSDTRNLAAELRGNHRVEKPVTAHRLVGRQSPIGGGRQHQVGGRGGRGR